MGDFASQFISAFHVGRQAKLQQEQHAQEQELHKLRIQALKAQMDQAKVEQKVHAYQANIQGQLNVPVTGAYTPDLGYVPGVGQGFQPQRIEGVQDPESGLNLPTLNESPYTLRQAVRTRKMQELGLNPTVAANRERIAAEANKPVFAPAGSTPFLHGVAQPQVATRPDTNVTPYEDYGSGDPAKMARAKSWQEILKPQKAEHEAGSYIPLTNSQGQVVGAWNPKAGQYVPIPGDASGLRRSGQSAAENVRQNELVQLRDNMKAALGLVKTSNDAKNAVGPLSGRLESLKANWWKGTSPEVTELLRLTDDAADRLLRARSGAQINEQEYQRLRPLVPDVRTPLNTFLKRMEIFTRELDNSVSRSIPENAPARAGEGDPLGLFK